MGWKKNICIVFIIMTIMMISMIAHAETEDLTDSSSLMPVKVLLLPKFEVGEMSGDFPGEAQFYYEHYLTGADEYEITNGKEGVKLYYKDGIALSVLGMGKINAALGTMAILSDKRFDFSDAYIISTGCAGSSVGNTVMGDVFIITAAVDYDLGHHADSREIADANGVTWFHDADFDDAAVIFLNQDLMEKVYTLVKDIPLETTERTTNYMQNAFKDEEWAARNPQVLRGTTVTGDNYWKGSYDHQNAQLMAETYQCPDPYTSAEMEDIAVARTAEWMGLLDRLIIIRDSVNMDVFMLGATPESLWGTAEAMDLAAEDSVEAADIFEVAMKNNFDVGKSIIDTIMSDSPFTE
ncbi:MAG: hypothetical protein IKE58_09735 [Blautia sp.]|nr:hypothetical protein [Blautia sp.]